MGLPVGIDSLLNNNIVESERIEFKSGWNAEAALKTICAFANDFDNIGGGYIVIGMSESEGKYAPSGVPCEQVDSIQRDILNACKKIKPEYIPEVSVEVYKDKHLVVIWAPGGDNRPYSSPRSLVKQPTDSRVFVPYIRIGSVTVAPSEDQIRELYSMAKRIPFDDRIAQQASLEDISVYEIASFLKETGSSLYDTVYSRDLYSVCRDMHIVSELPEYQKPKNVGILCFGKYPQKFFEYARIEVVVYPNNPEDKVKEYTFMGTLWNQYSKALECIKDEAVSMRIYKSDTTYKALHIYSYPVTAIEELLANAIYHKSYEIPEPVEVRIYPDSISFISYPGPTMSIKQEDIDSARVYGKHYRNRRIGEFLKELRLTEGRNTGLRKALEAMRRNGSPDPEYDLGGENREHFVATLKIHPEYLINLEDSDPEAVFERARKTNQF